MFQFGIPFLYALNPTYSNWYITQFDYPDLIYCVFYSVICIEFFILGAFFTSDKIRIKNNKNLTCFSDINNKNIYKVSLILFIATSIIVIPVTVYVIYLALLNGYNYVKTDSMGLFNGITRFGQGLIVPALILLIIYSPSPKVRKRYYIISIFYCAALLFTGGRTTSISMLISILFLNFKLKEDSENIKSKKLVFKKIVIILGILVIGVMGVWVAQIRFYGSIKSLSILSIFESLVEEMGGSIIPFAFTRYYIPSSEPIKYGLSYIYSFICLIPKSIDLTGYVTSINYSLPEFWIANRLSESFGDLYNFGIGYSVIAESYYNFGSYGFIAVFIQSVIINKLINIDYSASNSKKFKLYIEMVMLFSLITYPRRSFFTLLKSFEYYILCIALLIIFYCKGYKYKK